jgi:DNA-binding protein HU-beta
MSRDALIDRITIEHDMSRAAAERVLKTVLEGIVGTVAKGDELQFVGFGTFKRVERKPRTGRNPQTGEPVAIAGGWSPKFVPGAKFKTRVAEEA